MSKQPENPSALTLDTVVRLAKELTLRAGGHAPTVIAEGSRDSIVVNIDEIAATYEQRIRQMTALGALLARRGDVGVLQQAFFIAEGWMSRGSTDTPPTLPPSQDPQRREVLIVSHLDIRQAKRAVVLHEMTRNPQGTLLTLDALPETDGSLDVHSPLLNALATGFWGIRKR